MRFGKPVTPETLYLFKKLFRKSRFVVPFRHAFNQPVPEFVNPAIFFPARHSTAKLIGFPARKAGSDHRQLNNLFLKNRHAHGSG